MVSKRHTRRLLIDPRADHGCDSDTGNRSATPQGACLSLTATLGSFRLTRGGAATLGPVKDWIDFNGGEPGSADGSRLPTRM
eukprot:scaffold10975_cov105-Isochrysis_galbana.AAC.3